MGALGAGEDRNMRDQVQGGWMEAEKTEIDDWKGGAFQGRGGNLVLGKFPGIHKDDPSEDS